ncbi:MAG: imidazole glycerol phosphate synthase subunit HisH [Solirubrobacterales bacterium]
MTSARRPTVALLDYGMGNLHSVGKALEVAGAQVVTTAEPEVVERSDAVVLPGVGAFPKAMERLGGLQLDTAIVSAVERDRPLLGICLGLQLLFESSDEQGGAEGLGILPGKVVRLAGDGLKVPHIGWARVDWTFEGQLRDGIADGEAFYFVHSFVPIPGEADLLATASYGTEFACAAGRDRVFGVQFHPEKSSGAGLRLLSNFVKIVAEGGAT